MIANDCHCHFFSPRFLKALAREKGIDAENSGEEVAGLLGWDDPGSTEMLADRWQQELDQNQVGRAALIASFPGDEESVAAAIARHPDRFVGFFMVDPTQADTSERVSRAFSELKLRCACLFPGMHRYDLSGEATLQLFETAASHPGSAVFVHCGVLTVGARKKLGLPSRFDLRLSNPIHLHHIAGAFPELPLIIPHFGSGMFQEALMLADLCPNVFLDTSSSNGWIKYFPGLTLSQVYAQVLEVVGPERLLFGTDSSFFPRGWNRPVWEAQIAALEAIGLDSSAQEQILWKNFERLFPVLPEGQRGSAGSSQKRRP